MLDLLLQKKCPSQKFSFLKLVKLDRILQELSPFAKILFSRLFSTLIKSCKWYTVYICRVFQKGLIADEFYP